MESCFHAWSGYSLAPMLFSHAGDWCQHNNFSFVFLGDFHSGPIL